MVSYQTLSGSLVQWHDSRFGCERSRVQFPDEPYFINPCIKLAFYCLYQYIRMFLSGLIYGIKTFRVHLLCPQWLVIIGGLASQFAHRISTDILGRLYFFKINNHSVCDIPTPVYSSIVISQQKLKTEQILILSIILPVRFVGLVA